MCEQQPPITLSWREIRAAYPDTPVAILQRLGIDTRNRALTADGKVGPLTEGARYLNPARVTTPIARVALLLGHFGDRGPIAADELIAFGRGDQEIATGAAGLDHDLAVRLARQL